MYDTGLQKRISNQFIRELSKGGDLIRENSVVYVTVCRLQNTLYIIIIEGSEKRRKEAQNSLTKVTTN